MSRPAGWQNFGQRLAALASERPDSTSLRFISSGSNPGGEITWSWRTLAQRTAALSIALSEHVRPGERVLVALPNSPMHIASVLASWIAGASVVPVSPFAPLAEVQRIVRIARPSLLIRQHSQMDLQIPSLSADEMDLDSRNSSATSVLERSPNVEVPLVWPTSGSTGQPKLVVVRAPWGGTGELSRVERFLGLRPNQNQLVAGPMFHSAPLSWAHAGLFQGHRLTIMERFNASLALRLFDEHCIAWSFVVPTMMIRMAKDVRFADVSFASLDTLFHGGGPCPRWVKEAWVSRLGVNRICETYGPSEGFATTGIRGDAVLTHPGSVGRPLTGAVYVADSQGAPLTPGTIGMIFGRPDASASYSFNYEGASIDQTPDGFMKTGDLGWLDQDGFLYIADRQGDAIVRGGVNVYPAEVESALLQHDLVEDVAVVGMPDDELGQEILAIVQLADTVTSLDSSVLRDHARSLLAPHKVPRQWRFVPELPRDQAGKIRRSALLAQFR